MATDFREGKIIMHNFVCRTHRKMLFKNTDCNSSLSENDRIYWNRCGPDWPVFILNTIPISLNNSRVFFLSFFD